MSITLEMVLISHDKGLLEHWQRAFLPGTQIIASRFMDFRKLKLEPETLIWIDLSLPDLPSWNDPLWSQLTNVQKVRVIATSSNPRDREAVIALDVGCAAYCHAFSDASTLTQVKQVVQAGHVWIGKTLMQRLIQSAGHAAVLKTAVIPDWGDGLTIREREVAILAANGASNHAISLDCKISERTVKAHLSAVFDKLNLTDRLQLALRVHGIN
jgi:DNA-binding NarL/FixJ family response regulator